MDTEKPRNMTQNLREIWIGVVEVCVALCILAFFAGGPETRAWMLGFLQGTLFSVEGHSSSSAATIASEDPPLKLLGHGCRREWNYQICEGEVRNQTDQKLENVMAEVRFTGKTGTFIKSADAMIDYQPLMPGQTSAFKVVTTTNPEIWHFSIRFREMFGGELKAAR
jgi:hypothetical protein